MDDSPSDNIIVGEGHTDNLDSMESLQERASMMEELAKILQIDIVEAHVLLRRYKWNMQEVINNFLDAGSDGEVIEDESSTPKNADKFVLDAASICGVSHEEACQLLKRYNGNLDATINEYFQSTNNNNIKDETSRLPNYYTWGTSSTSYALSSANPKPSFPDGLPTVGSWRIKNSNRPTKRRDRNLAHSDLKDEDATHLVGEDFVSGDEQEEEMGVSETYADYKPAKLKIGKGHPDPVVETASLASVLPPDVYYQLHLPSRIIEQGKLSALQLEAVVYACQQHENILSNGQRAGFLIGDGAGVGKGRTIAGIIYENYICGRKKAIWVSVSGDLKYDSERDIQDIGAKMDVHTLNKLKYGKIPSSIRKGVIFSTYSSLIGKTSAQEVGSFDTRLKQLLHWCGTDFDGVIVFDECHRAKNLVPTVGTAPTKTGLAVRELQNCLPKARIVYASATGASEPRNVAYMTRLGIWGPSTPFLLCSDFIHAVEKRGVGAMELVAMDLKLRGTYIARQLSFKGVTFKIEECPLEPDFIKVYDQSVALWVELKERFTTAANLMQYDGKQKKNLWGQFWGAHQRFFKYLCIATKVEKAVEIAIKTVKAGKCVVIGLQSTGEARTLDQLDKADGELNEFVSTAKGILENLVEKQFPCKMTESTNACSIVLAAEKDEDKVAPTGPKKRRKKGEPAKRKAKRPRLEYEFSDDSDSDSDDSDDNFSDASTISITSENDDNNNNVGKQKKEEIQCTGKTRKAAADVIKDVEKMKTDLFHKIELLGERLPPNVLDQLIDSLGGPFYVAEMTGRKGRVIQYKDGTVGYESRAGGDIPLEMMNLTEKQSFMDGRKKIAIISEAASSGISLQSDKRAKNTSTRVHITLELPWSADRAIQQFGRTHRSNQESLPEYVFLISDLAGEYRFASIVAKRLESLGALTHGDRRATETLDLSRFHIDTKYGKQGLRHVFGAILDLEPPIVEPRTDYSSPEDFFVCLRESLLGVGLIVKDKVTGIFKLEKDHTNMTRFLNRILGTPVRLQNTIFEFLSDAIKRVVLIAKRNGQFDLGIRDLGNVGSGGITKIDTITYAQQHTTGVGKLELHHLLVQRGLSWEDALAKYADLEEDEEGFYLSKQRRNNKLTATLVVAVKRINGETSKADDKKYYVFRPNTGLMARRHLLIEIEHKWDLVSPERARKHWKHQYDSSKTICNHAFWSGNCTARAMGAICEDGVRQQNYYLLSGSVLMVWNTVEKVISQQLCRAKDKKIQIIRVRDEEVKTVGVRIPTHCVSSLISELEVQCLGMEREEF